MDASQIKEQIDNGTRPENSTYDRNRHDTMRLKRNGLYGIPKIHFNSANVFPGTCLGCIFKNEVHICGR